VLIGDFFSAGAIVSSLTLALFLFGFIKKLLCGIDVMDYIFIITAIVILVFPAYQGFRYLLPIYPFVIVYIILGAKSIKLNNGIINEYLLSLIIIILLYSNYYEGINNVIKSQIKVKAGPQTAYSKEAFDYIKKNTDINSTFVFVKPRVLALYTSRKSIGVGLGKNMQEMDEKFSEVGVDYLLTLEDLQNMTFDKYIEYYGSELELVWENERFKMYKRN
jgi:hypothetical protein